MQLRRWQLDTAISQNPYLEFRFIAQDSGELRMLWISDDDLKVEVTYQIKVG